MVKHIPDVRGSTLAPEVRRHVEPGSEIFTDAWRPYDGLVGDYVHNVIDHAESYAEGKVHTNGLENFWSLLKRGIKGIYVSVEPFHLFRYLDGQAYRFNTRKMKDGMRFVRALAGIVGKRLIYQHLMNAPGYDVTPGKDAGKDAGRERNLTPFERLTDVARRLVAVRKSELPAQERKFQRAKKKHKRSPPHE